MNNYKKTALNKVTRGSNRATYDVDLINSIIDSGFIGYIAYNYDKRAITIPMAYGRIENKIYLHGSRKNRMLLALLEHKAASITIMHLDGLVLARSAFHHSVNYRSATLFGNITKIDKPDKKEEALKCIVEQMIPNRWKSLRPMTKKEFNATLVIELEIETASAKIRAEGVNDEKHDIDLPIWAGIIPLKQISETPIRDKDVIKKVETPKHILAYHNTNKN